MIAGHPTRRTTMAKVWRWFLAILGSIVIMLSGLIWDALIHSQELRHLAEESLLDLSNPGHVVFGLGLVLTALIALVGFTASWLEARRWKIGWQKLSVPAVLWLIVGLVAAFTLAALARTG